MFTAPQGSHFQMEEVRTARGQDSLSEVPILVWDDWRAAAEYYGDEGITRVLNGTSLRVSYHIDGDESQTLSFFKGKGCPTCNAIGYRGRRAIFEAIPASPEVRSALEGGRPAKDIEQAAIESGMITIRERALALVREGVTTFEEFARLRL